MSGSPGILERLIAAVERLAEAGERQVVETARLCAAIEQAARGVARSAVLVEEAAPAPVAPAPIPEDSPAKGPETPAPAVTEDAKRIAAGSADEPAPQLPNGRRKPEYTSEQRETFRQNAAKARAAPAPRTDPSALTKARALPQAAADTATPIVADFETIRSVAGRWGLTFETRDDLAAVNEKAARIGHRPFALETTVQRHRARA